MPILVRLRLLPLFLLVLAATGAGGCRHLGPRTIVADRVPYAEAVAASWKEQTLLNIVKLRYFDTPFFVDVPQITAGYQLVGSATTSGGVSPPASPAATFAQQLGINLNLQGGYQDRPTISYQPQTGSQFIRNLTTPINPGSIMFLLQAGYPADFVFELTVDSINGVRNRSVAGGQMRPASPEFAGVIQSLRKAQGSGHFGIRVQRDKDQKDSVAIFLHDKDVDPDLAAELAAVRRALRLSPDQTEFRVTFGAVAAGPNEIAILSRSAIRILQELAAFVDVPIEHLAAGIAPPLGPEADGAPLFQVLSGPKKPCDPFAAVCYEGRWFWIDKSDTRSKRIFASLLVLLALADTGAKEHLPIITIQAN